MNPVLRAILVLLLLWAGTQPLSIRAEPGAISTEVSKEAAGAPAGDGSHGDTEGQASKRPTRAALADSLSYDLSVDLPLTLGAGAIYVGLNTAPGRQVVQEGARPHSGPGGVDHLAVLELRREFILPSDLVLAGGLALGLLFSGADGLSDDGSPLPRLLLFAEALAINGALTELAKYAVRRPRPYTFSERLGTPDDDLSFFSGHASHVAVSTFFAARSLDLTGDLSLAERVLAYGGATLLTATVAALRVAAGKHWPSDVLTGALVGGSVGFLVAELHRSEALAATAWPLAGGGAVALTGTF